MKAGVYENIWSSLVTALCVFCLIYVYVVTKKNVTQRQEIHKQELYFQSKDEYSAYVFWCKINNRQDITYEMWQSAKRSGLIGNQPPTKLSK